MKQKTKNNNPIGFSFYIKVIASVTCLVIILFFTREKVISLITAQETLKKEQFTMSQKKYCVDLDKNHSIIFFNGVRFSFMAVGFANEKGKYKIKGNRILIYSSSGLPKEEYRITKYLSTDHTVYEYEAIMGTDYKFSPRFCYHKKLFTH